MEIGPWNFGYFDVVVFIILGFSAILAFARGFSRELISLISLLIGLVGALFLFGRYRLDVQKFIKPDWLADGVLFIGVFGALYLIATFIMRGWAKSIQGRSPGFLDRLLGLGYGMARGAVLASLFVMVVAKSAKDKVPADWMTNSVTYPILRSISDGLQKLPFARAKEIAEDIKTQGEESDILPDIPSGEEPDSPQNRP